MEHSNLGPWLISFCVSPVTPPPVDMGWNVGDHHLPEGPAREVVSGPPAAARSRAGAHGLGLRGEEEESLALFEGKEGQVGKMTLLGRRSLEMATWQRLPGGHEGASTPTSFASSLLLRPLS